MKRLALLISVLLVAACNTPSSTYLDWLYASMPLPDSLQHSRSWWEANVEKTLQVRKDMHWNIPEREFRHFVLPLRVNNESLDDFRLTYADTLCRRVAGMTLTEAALEINHWCHEQASYEPSDARTSSPMQTVRRGVGRCGEESVLTVAALRAAGIPARQVYTPRWAHTDDNHAWVEVWTEDGKWHFLGACEPAPTLDNAWFNAPVSRALILHTKVFGDYKGPEDVIQRTPCYTEINVIRGYVPARRTVVTVLDGGTPVEGARVEFKIYNYAEFYTVAAYTTGRNGTASLDTGLGDMLVWASKGDRFGFAVADSDKVSVSLDHRLGECLGADIDIVPPAENPIPSGATPEQEEANKIRLAQEDAIRASHPHNNPDADAFVAEYGSAGETLLGMLSAKDRGDVPGEVLEDAIEGYALLLASGRAGELPSGIGKKDVSRALASIDPYIASQRIEIEPLAPYRWEILDSGIGSTLTTPESVIAWVRDSITVVDGRNPQRLRTSPVAVWRSRKADALGRDIFFAALCRTLGIPARIDPVTGKTQYRDGSDWIDVRLDGSAGPAAAPTGILILTEPGSGESVRPMDPKAAGAPEYYRHYSFTRLDRNGSKLMEYDEYGPACFEYSLDEGYYVLTSGTRLSDGSVLAHMEFFPVVANYTTSAPLVLRKVAGKLSVIGTMDPEAQFLPDGAAEPVSLLSVAGRGMFLVAVMGEGDEPTNHAVHELEAASEVLHSWGRPVITIKPENDPDGSIRAMLAASGNPGNTLPIIALCDSFGKVYYISKGYNTSLAADMGRILSGD